MTHGGSAMRMKQVLITAVVALGVVIAYDTHKNKS